MRTEFDGEMKRRPRKLKELACENLGLEIQGENNMHDYVEDAWVCMVLYKVMKTNWDSTMMWKLNKTKEIECEM